MVRKRVPESEVEDIVQSTLADAIESPHAPQDSESLRRWIFGVAKNKVVDYHRRAGRESFEIPENVAGKAAPHIEADLLRWAEKNLPPGEENKTTLDWMLREGEGEKLEWIAENENVPAPRVRQRVSRLRRHLKQHWQKEVALLAALGVLISILVLVLKRKEPEPIANENLPRAAEIRKVALEKCGAGEWTVCVDKLDEAKKLDPAGDTKPEVQQARQAAEKARNAPSPSPSTGPTTENTVAPPLPSATPFDFATKEADAKEMKTLEQKRPDPKKAIQKPQPSDSSFTPSPAPTPTTPPGKPTAKMKGSSLDDSMGLGSDLGGGSGVGSGSGTGKATKSDEGFGSKSAPKSPAKKKSAPMSKSTIPSVNVTPTK